MTKYSGECKSPWFIYFDGVFVCTFFLLDGFINMKYTGEFPSFSPFGKLKFFFNNTHNLRKSLGTVVAQKRKSIDKNQRSQGTFQTWSQTHKSWKTHVKKAERTFTLCCSVSFFLVSNLHLSESCASVVLGCYYGPPLRADHHFGYQMHRSCLLSIKLSLVFCSAKQN